MSIRALTLGGKPSEPVVKISYKDGKEFDMTRTRVKETEVNLYKPDRTRPKWFDDALDKKVLKEHRPKKK
ncbi:hypothetical protein KCG43_09745 [Photobacterium sp. WH24]|uniref:hypothetical protein n=1 Tax=Photobacterium sp. WH24 TaxID=2827237 RepID=UPI001C4901F1|nr:hypothetical protein [Photobacterium sp. WH24]MBV7262280.1 hypothetical protein [Photobacterium sp. WH24]